MQEKVEKAVFAPFDASDYHIGIVVSRFNRDITEELLAEAQKALQEYKVKPENTDIKRVAGSIEAPVMLRALAETKRYDCLLALGCVIRGDTPHFDYVCKMVSEGVLRLQLDYGLPTGFGVLTVDNKKQALSRFHVGREAVEAALQVARELKKI